MMKRFGCTLLLCLFSISMVIGQAPKLSNPATTEEKELLSIEYKRSAAIAKHDTKFLNELYTDDFRGVTAIGLEVDKARLMYVFSLDNPQVKFELDELKARIFGDTALVTGRLRGKNPTGELVHDSKYIHVYVKRAGRWQIVAGQGTMVPQSEAAK